MRDFTPRHVEMPGQRDGVDGTSLGKHSAFQALGQREQHPDLLPGMCQTSLLDALMHHRQSTPGASSQGRRCPVAGSVPRLPPGIQRHIKGAACDSSRQEPSCSPCLTSLLLSFSPLLPARCSWCSSRAEIRESKRMVFLEQAVKERCPQQPRAGKWLQKQGMAVQAFCFSQVQVPSLWDNHTVGELR